VQANDGVWIIVPAYNEGPRLTDSLEALCRRFQQIVLVDDGSEDDTAEVADRFQIHRVRHLINRGQGAAIRTGLDYALTRGAKLMVTFDADGQHSVEDIESISALLLTGEVDVTLGSRFLGSTDGMPWSRRIILKVGVLFTRMFSRIHVTDTHNGLRGFSRTAAQTIQITEDDYAHASEILDEVCRHKLAFREVPVRIRYSASTLAKGQTSWNALRIVGRLLMGRLFR
jgi:glycosyltransferase involved in cell wall biosynthesis